MGRRAAILAALLAACGFWPARAPAGTGEARRGAVEFLSPAEGSRLAEGKAVLTGRLARGHEKAQLFLNGRPLLKVSRNGGSFSATLEPSRGHNVVEAREKSVLGSLTFTYGGQGGPVYAYHRPVLDGNCKRCHGPGMTVRAPTCYGCHGAWKNPFVHGPIGAGECVFCHDPHGSVLPSMGRYEGKKECVRCHSQPASQEHMNRGQNQVCVKCHDPHGGRNKYFLKKG